jgi:hypothetical protein
MFDLLEDLLKLSGCPSLKHIEVSKQCWIPEGFLTRLSMACPAVTSLLLTCEDLEPHIAQELVDGFRLAELVCSGVKTQSAQILARGMPGLKHLTMNCMEDHWPDPMLAAYPQLESFSGQPPYLLSDQLDAWTIRHGAIRKLCLSGDNSITRGAFIRLISNLPLLEEIAKEGEFRYMENDPFNDDHVVLSVASSCATRLRRLELRFESTMDGRGLQGLARSCSKLHAITFMAQKKIDSETYETLIRCTSLREFRVVAQDISVASALLNVLAGRLEGLTETFVDNGLEVIKLRKSRGMMDGRLAVTKELFRRIAQSFRNLRQFHIGFQLEFPLQNHGKVRLAVFCLLYAWCGL